MQSAPTMSDDPTVCSGRPNSALAQHCSALDESDPGLQATVDMHALCEAAVREAVGEVHADALLRADGADVQHPCCRVCMARKSHVDGGSCGMPDPPPTSAVPCCRTFSELDGGSPDRGCIGQSPESIEFFSLEQRTRPASQGRTVAVLDGSHAVNGGEVGDHGGRLASQRSVVNNRPAALEQQQLIEGLQATVKTTQACGAPLTLVALLMWRQMRQTSS